MKVCLDSVCLVLFAIIYLTILKDTYIFVFDTAHIIKNIRNNFIFIFPLFAFQGLCNDIKVNGGEISWQVLHELYEKDGSLQDHLKAAP